MSLIDDNEFIIIHIDENNENPEVSEYIQMKEITSSSSSNSSESDKENIIINDSNFENVMTDLVNSVIDDVIEEVVNEIIDNTITKQPTMLTRESQTNISLSINECEDENRQTLENYDYKTSNYNEEEEPCLYYYKKNNSNKNKRRYKRPRNKSDCFAGLKRFIRYIFNI